MCLAIPGELIETHERDGLLFGKVRFGGIRREVCLEYVREAEVGDFVLVHVGFAIARVDRDEAERTWALLEELGEADGLLTEPPEGGAA